MGKGVSVIIPTWNRSATLERAIRSALAQTVEVSEVLVCDDGSSDDSREVVRAIHDSRVRWVEGERGGRPAIPRNRGIRESRGEWLAFLDDDDEWLPKKLETQLALADRQGCLASCSNAVRLVPGKEGEVLLDWCAERLTLADLLRVNRVVCSSALVHRSLFAVIEGFPETPRLIVGEDYALWLRVATRTDFAYVADPLLYYWDDPANSVRKEGPGEKKLRKFVLRNFAKWSSRAGLPGECRTQVAKEYWSAVLAGWWEYCRILLSRFARIPHA